MQQTPPLASISHSTPAARTPQTQRQHHTKGGGGESQWVGERGSFISSHHLLSLLWKKKRKESSQLSFLPLFFFMPLTSSLVNNKKEKKKKGEMHQKISLQSSSWCNSRYVWRGDDRKREERTSSLHFQREEWCYFFLRRERLQMCCGAPPYILPIPPSIPCLSTAHVTSPCCHGYGSTCCRQEEEEERKRSWGQESKKGMKRKGGKTKRGLKKKRTGQEGWGKEAKERDEAVRKGGEGIKGKKAGHSFLQVIPTCAAS